LTELFLRATYTRTIFLKFGKRDTNSSEIEPGQKPEDVKNVQNIPIVWEMVCITGI
jgi:hypothetical protein